MSRSLARGPQPAPSDVLDAHITAFRTRLADAGYAPKTVQHKCFLAARFIDWLRASERVDAVADHELQTQYLTREERRVRACERAALRQFVAHVWEQDDAERHSASGAPDDVLLARYVAHIRDARGLAPRSIEVYSPFVRRFIAAQHLPDRIASLDTSCVRSYVLERTAQRSDSYIALLVATLRSFLRFLFLDGVTATDLSRAVPPVRRRASPDAPPLLTADQIERVLDAVDRSTPSGARAVAILVLLARLGLRAGEVVALELDDIHWDVGEVVVRGKGRIHDHMPLLDDVGEALARYLRDARPSSSSRRVFLRLLPPHVGLSGPTAICVTARQALRRAGIRLEGRVGAHVFRHGLATAMIQHGASLGEIAQVLRHRSVATTAIYAQVEFAALRCVARPWPIAEASR